MTTTEDINIPDSVIAFLNKRATPENITELHLWLENKENKRIFDEISDIWGTVILTKDDSDAYDPGKAWNHLFSNINTIQHSERIADQAEATTFAIEGEGNPPSKRNLLISFLQIAAIIVIAFTAGITSMHFYYKSSSVKTPIAFIRQVVPLGSRSIIYLPDGSKVWLNSGSSIRYTQNFNQKVREVFLSGEAYFDVKHNNKVPFFVNASGVRIKVLGTAFNVKAYPEEKSVETTVERGNIMINYHSRNSNEDQHIILSANQKASIFKVPTTEQNSSVPVSPITKDNSTQEDQTMAANNIKISNIVIFKDIKTVLYTSWKDKRWIIEQEDLGSLAQYLSRRYDVKIHFKSDNIKKYIFSGMLENESLEQVLQVIKYTAPISYSINGKNVTLRENTLLSSHLR